MIARQMSLDEALRLRDEGIAQVLENADGDNVIGAVFNHAAKAGLIRSVRFTRSAQVRGHANTIRLYRGVA